MHSTLLLKPGQVRLLTGFTICVLLWGCGPAPEPQAAALLLPPAPSGVVLVPAPPALGSPELEIDLVELRAVRQNLTEAQKTTIADWDARAVLRWNELARELVSQTQADPLLASRAYALLSVAQHEALEAAEANQRHYGRQMPGPDAIGGAPLLPSAAPGAYPSEHAAVAAASATVLAALFPIGAQQVEAQRAEHQESRLWAGLNCRGDINAGDALGRQVAARLLEQADADLLAATSTWDGQIPTGPGVWFSSLLPPMPPLSPHWGKLRPWLMSSPDQFRAPPPPAFGSTEFNAALREVRQISDTRTAEQTRIAEHWADGKGTPTPPGRWNAIAADLIAAERMSQRDAARTLAFLNMALLDAGISSWDSKFAFWLIRPSQADPRITTPVVLPNFPAYTSGHAAFSGAAAEFLGAVFPQQREALWKQAEEAALSRVYGGIHYRFDSERGLEQGQAVGRLAVEHMRQ